MKIPKKYYIWLGIGMLMLMTVEYFKKQEIDWRPTYSSFDKIPYGTEINYQLLQSGKWEGSIERSNLTFYEYNTIDSSNYTSIFIANSVDFDSESFDRLKNHVASGNTALVVSKNISDNLLSYFGLKVKHNLANKDLNVIRLNSGEAYTDTLIRAERAVNFPYFTWNDTITNVVELGTQNELPNYIKLKHGKGEFFLHLNPMPFTNYCILHKLSINYVNHIFAGLPNSPIVWDDYMNYGHRKSSSEMRYVLTSASMKMAFYILSVLLVLYISLAWRRKQRMIPVLHPIKNSSLEFIDTLTNLYLSNKNNGIIASYIVKNFKIKTNRKYLIHWNKSMAQVKEQLLNKSGKTEQEVNLLLSKIELTTHAKTISQTELVELNKRIEEFIK